MDLKNFYEKSANIYNPEKIAISKGGRRLVTHDDRFETMVEFLGNELGASDGVRVLDVGCGDGVYEKNLDRQIIEKNHFFGLDISENQISRNQGLFRELKGMDFEREQIPYADGSFDYIICSEVLEHLFTPENIMSEMKRVLKKGGKLIITVPNLSCLQNRLSLLFFGDSPAFNYLQNKEHIRYYTKKTLKEMLGNDFELLKSVGINNLLFERYLFPIRIILPYFVQRIANYLFPGLGAGLFLIFQKNA